MCNFHWLHGETVHFWIFSRTPLVSGPKRCTTILVSWSCHIHFSAFGKWIEINFTLITLSFSNTVSVQPQNKELRLSIGLMNVCNSVIKAHSNTYASVNYQANHQFIYIRIVIVNIIIFLVFYFHTNDTLQNDNDVNIQLKIIGNNDLEHFSRSLKPKKCLHLF